MRVVHLPNDLMGRQKKRRRKSILVLAINIYVSITCFLIVLRLRLLCHDHVLKFLSNVFFLYKAWAVYSVPVHIPMITESSVNCLEILH